MDAHSFTAGADHRVYAATTTGLRDGSAGTLRDIIASDGTTVLEGDGENGAIGSASNLPRTVLATAEALYVRMRRFNIPPLPGTIRRYDFYLRVLSGSPRPAMEPNDKGAPQTSRSNGRVSRLMGPATAKNDTFAITVNGGDTIVVIVDVDLERGAPDWDVIDRVTGSFIIRL